MSVTSRARSVWRRCLARWRSPAPVVPKEKAPAPAQRLRKELDKSIDFETTDQPLDLALDQLREQTKINFVLDRQTLAQMNIDPNQTPIKVKLKEARVKTVLRTILEAHNLGYAIIGDTVFVSSDEMTMFRQMQQRVNLDVEKVEFAAALRQLSRETATNLIIDSRVAKEANQTGKPAGGGRAAGDGGAAAGRDGGPEAGPRGQRPVRVHQGPRPGAACRSGPGAAAGKPLCGP